MSTLDSWLNMALNHGATVQKSGIKDAMWLMPGAELEGADSFNSVTYGPKHKRFLLVAPSPSFEDYKAKRYGVSPVGKLLKSSLVAAGIDLKDVYITTLTRFAKPYNIKTMKKCWLVEGLELFHAELDIVKPDAILFLGSEVLSALFGSNAKLEVMRNQIIDYRGYKATAATNPLAFVSNTAGVETLIKQFAFFAELGVNKNMEAWSGTSLPVGRDYKILYDLAQLEDEIKHYRESAGNQIIAFDVEHATDTGRPEDTYLISLQWSDRPGHARLIPFLTETENADGTVQPKSKSNMVPHYPKLKELVNELMQVWYDKKVLHVGHNGRGDLSLLNRQLGVDVRRILKPGYYADTMLCRHMLAKDSYSLKHMALLYTDMGAYEAPMYSWVAANCGPGKLFPGAEADRFFYGFRDIAYKYLLPYALCDADATRRIYEPVHAELHAPGNERIRDVYYNIEIPVQHGILDIERNGLFVDRKRFEDLSEQYLGLYSKALVDLQEFLNWPDFNPGSTDMVSGLLYAPPFKKSDNIVARLPEGIRTLNLPPILDSSKPPRKWSDIVEDGEELFASPSTSYDTLEKLRIRAKLDADSYEGQVLSKLLAISAIGMMCKTYLQPPVYTKLAEKGKGKPVYGKGLLGSIRDDDTIACEISTTSETGRWMHRMPNLAALPKSQEKLIKKLFPGFDPPPLRTGFCVPEGWLLFEADYKSAELFCLAYLSGDKVFIDVVETCGDAHGYNAKQIFNLTCSPDEVKKLYPDLRDAIKAVCFGIIYGLTEVGLSENLSVVLKRVVTVGEASDIIAKFFKLYPGIKSFLDKCEDDAENRGYVETAFGRRRYFPGVALMGRRHLAAAKREAKNAAIQGTVADLLNLAVINLDKLRYETDIGKRIQWRTGLTVHDALMTQALEKYKHVMAKIIKASMCTGAVIPGTNGKTLNVDVSCGRRWLEFEEIHV